MPRKHCFRKGRGIAFCCAVLTKSFNPILTQMYPKIKLKVVNLGKTVVAMRGPGVGIYEAIEETVWESVIRIYCMCL